MLKKLPFHALVFTFLSVAFLPGCKKAADPDPVVATNEITDAGGLKVTITYDKNPTTTDLDLYLYRKSTYAATSNPQGATIGPTDTGTVSTDIAPAAPDDDYLVIAAYRTGTVAKTYSVVFTGITDKKSYTVNGSFAASLAPFTTYNYFGTPRGNSITLKKVKNTYTITP